MIPILNGWQFVDLEPDGGPYDELVHPKVVVHTTEGTTLAGAESAYRTYPPHLGYDPTRRIKHQYVRLDRHSYSLRGSESDDEFCIQVEIVGFANDTHNWSDAIYLNIATDVVAPLTEAIKVPPQHLRFYRANEGIVLASPNSPIRLTNTQFRNFSGWLGHQHVPDPDSHWDPGGFLMDKALQYAGATMSVASEVWDEANLDGKSARQWLQQLPNAGKAVWDDAILDGMTARERLKLTNTKLQELELTVDQLRDAFVQLATAVTTGYTLEPSGSITVTAKPNPA